MADTPRIVLVLGNGGRECALATALLESPGVAQVILAPPNHGVRDAQHVPPDAATGPSPRLTLLELDLADHAAVVAAALLYGAELAVIGPEAPLCAGLADALRAAGIPCAGPGRVAAQLEGSKAFAKDFMRRHGLPTASSAVFTDYAALCEYVTAQDRPLVLKADGLAAGKGVLLCPTRDEGLSAAARLMQAREFGTAGATVVVEEMLSGREISCTCIVASGEDGVAAGQLVATSTDYKRLGDGDTGPNTGGMGNICPSPFATPEVLQEFHDAIFAPLLLGLQQDKLDYRGFLFIGVMLTDAGLKVLEFNVRLGDPEAEVVLPLSDANWAQVLSLVAQGSLPQELVQLRDGACVAVVLASANYPYGRSEPAPITGLERLAARGLLHGAPPAVRVYFSGVGLGSPGLVGRAAVPAQPESRFVATGGRVLVLSALGRDLSDARRNAYEAVGNIRFDGMGYRGDIGYLG